MEHYKQCENEKFRFATQFCFSTSNFSVSVISFVTVNKEMSSEVILSFLCAFIGAL